MTYEEALVALDDKWHTLSDEQKIEVLQSIEFRMAEENNRIACPVEGKFLYTGTDGVVLGAYLPQEGKIYVNTSQFDMDSMYGSSSDRIVKTVLHEGRHALQHQVVDGTVKYDNQQEVEEWKYNLDEENYISYKDNPKAYYNQPVELDARKFADERFEILMNEKKSLSNEMLDDQECICDYAGNIFEEQMESDMKYAADYIELDHFSMRDIGECDGMKV